MVLSRCKLFLCFILAATPFLLKRLGVCIPPFKYVPGCNFISEISFEVLLLCSNFDPSFSLHGKAKRLKKLSILRMDLLLKEMVVSLFLDMKIEKTSDFSLLIIFNDKNIDISGILLDWEYGFGFLLRCCIVLLKDVKCTIYHECLYAYTHTLTQRVRERERQRERGGGQAELTTVDDLGGEAGEVAFGV